MNNVNLDYEVSDKNSSLHDTNVLERHGEHCWCCSIVIGEFHRKCHGGFMGR